MDIQSRLHFCCLTGEGKIETLREILLELEQTDKRHLIDAQNQWRRTPLTCAIESNKPLDFLRVLLDFKPRLTALTLLHGIRRGNLDILRLLKEYGADFRQMTDGISLLHECILLHKNHLIEFLVNEAEIDPDVLDSDGQSPLLIAIYRMNIEAIQILLSFTRQDPAAIGTRRTGVTCLHSACELGIEDVIPSMLKLVSTTNINCLSNYDQTAFDLFLSCYLFSKNNLYMTQESLTRFSSLFDLFVSGGAKLHHITRAYRRTRAPYVTKILTLLLRKPLLWSTIILETDRASIYQDFQTLVCESLCDWPYILESNETITTEQYQLVLRELQELFLLTYFKSINRLTINQRLLARHCLANAKSSKLKKELWMFIQNFTRPDKSPKKLKSICRTKILLNIKSLDTLSRNDLSMKFPKHLKTYFLFVTSS